MTRHFSWTLICPSFSSVCPSFARSGAGFGDRTWRYSIVNLSEASGKINLKTGVRRAPVRQRRKEINMAYFQVATTYSAPSTRPTHPKWFLPFVHPSKRYLILLQYTHVVFADNSQLDGLALSTLCGLSPLLINRTKAAYAQGASGRTHPCCPGAGARASLRHNSVMR